MRLCPVCRTELVSVKLRRAARRAFWCWKCEAHWKAGITPEKAAEMDAQPKDPPTR